MMCGVVGSRITTCEWNGVDKKMEDVDSGGGVLLRGVDKQRERESIMMRTERKATL
jgi:hypothetical protein